MKGNEAVKLLEDCEQKLRRIVAAAAGEGDYISVQRIADWAKAIGALASEARSGRPGALNPPSDDRALARNGDRISPAAGGRRLTSAPEDYPKFFRRGDELVKVGWSKKERKEYNHRAPRHAVDAVAAAVRHVGAKGRFFNGDALLPLKDPSGGGAIPDYQAYVALAWLKHLGAVEQRGRRAGYTLDPSKQIDSAITAAWPELAEWRG
jgi:hypothetical protein